MADNTKDAIELAINILSGSKNESSVKKIKTQLKGIQQAGLNAQKSIDSLQKSLNKLKAGANVNKVVTSLEKLNNIKVPNIKSVVDGLKSLSGMKVPNLDKFVKELDKFSKIRVPNVKQIADGIKSIAEQSLIAGNVGAKLRVLYRNLKDFDKINVPNLKNIAEGVKEFAKLNLGNTPSNLKILQEALRGFKDIKLPGIASMVAGLQKLINLDIDKVSAKIKELNVAIRNLDKAGHLKNFAKFASDLRIVESALGAATSASKRTKEALKSTGDQAARSGQKLRTFGDRIRTVFQYRTISDAMQFIKEGIRSAITSIVEYDQALKDLQAITSATSLQVEQMGDKIVEVASKTKFSAAEVATGMRTIGQAGFSAAEAIETMQAVSDLATGTLSDMAGTVDLVTTTMRVFSIDASKSAEIADVFANAVNRSKLTIDKLKTAMNYLGPIARDSGVSFKELSAAMMVLANSGLRASKIGTGLRRVFAELVDPSKKLETAARKAGISLAELDPRSASLSTVIRNLGVVVNDAQIAFDIFGKRGASAVLALADSEGHFDNMLQTVERSGTAAGMAAIQMEGLGVSFKNLKDKLGLLAIALGEAGITDAMRILIDLFRGLVDILTVLIDNTIAKFIGKSILLTGALYGIGKAVIALIGTAKVITQMAAAMKLVTASVAASQGALVIYGATVTAALTPLTLFAGAVGAIAYAMYKLSDQAKESSEEALKMRDSYKQLAKHMRDYYEETSILTKGSDKLNKVNKDLRIHLMQTAGGFDELAVYAMAAAQSIDPLTGNIEKGEKRLKAYNEQLAKVDFKKLTEAGNKANESFDFSVSKLQRFITQAKDNLVGFGAAMGLVDKDFGGETGIAKLSVDVERLSKDLQLGVKGFKDLDNYMKAIDHTRLTAQQKSLKEQWISLLNIADQWLGYLRDTNQISMDQSIKEIERLAEKAGVSGSLLEALVIQVEAFKKANEGHYSNIIEKWASELEDGQLNNISEYIKKHKELNKAVTDGSLAQIQAAETTKRKLVEDLARLDKWKKGEIDAGNTGKKMYEDYISTKNSLARSSALVIAELNENADAQRALSYIAEEKAYAEHLSVIEAKTGVSEEILAKMRIDARDAHRKKMEDIAKGYIDPKQLLDSVKEEELILKTSNKAKQEQLELDLRKRGESEETIRKEIQLLEQGLANTIVKLWKDANDKIIKQKDESTKSGSSIRAKLIKAELEVIKSRVALEKAALDIKIADQNTAYENANTKRDVEHAKLIADITKRELDAGTSSENIEKKKADATVEYYKDRLYAAASHFGQAKKLYAEDSDEYQNRQKEYLDATKEFYNARLEYTETYAQIEYEIEKAKIKAILALNDAIFDSDSKRQQARIQVAESNLKNMYAARVITIKAFYDERRNLAEKDINEDIARTIKHRDAQKKALDRLIEAEKTDKSKIDARKTASISLNKIETELAVLEAKREIILNNLTAAQDKDTEASNKRVDAMLRQVRELKIASDIDVSSEPKDIKARQEAEKKAFEQRKKLSLEGLKNEININKARFKELESANEIWNQLEKNLESKQGQERLKIRLDTQDREYTELLANEDLIHAKKLENIAKQDAIKEGGGVPQKAEKDKLQADVDYYATLSKLADDHLKKVNKYSSPEEHSRRLNAKIQADKAYTDAVTSQIIGLHDLQMKLAEAEADTRYGKEKSAIELAITAQNEKAKTAFAEAKAAYDQDELNTKEYFDEKRRIAEEDIKSQLDLLEKKKAIFEAEMAMKISLAEDDPTKKAALEIALRKGLLAISKAEVIAKEQNIRLKEKIDADEYKKVEQNAKAVTSILEKAIKERDTLAAQTKDSTLKERNDAELAEFDRMATLSTKNLIKKTDDEDVIQQHAALKAEARRSLVLKQEEAVDDARLNAKISFFSGMSSIAQDAYAVGILQGKKGFAAMKAFMVAETIIKTYKSAQDAYESAGNPYLGAVMAALAVAQGMMNVAKINAQQPAGYAEGGMIGGHSPTTTADNIGIMATAGEYMQPVAAVRKYGKPAMDALRSLSIPAEALKDLVMNTTSGVAAAFPSYYLAKGGPTPSVPNLDVALREKERPATPFTILNVVDPKEMLSAALATPEGQGAILNFVSVRSQTIKGILKG